MYNSPKDHFYYVYSRPEKNCVALTTFEDGKLNSLGSIFLKCFFTSKSSKNSMFQNLTILLKWAVEAIKWPFSDISMRSTDLS